MGGEAMTLVDASSWIEFLRQRTSEPGLRVKSLLADGSAVWCELTIVELWNGARGHVEKSVLEELEEELRIYPINEAVWKMARVLARGCREHGINAPATDVVIAACAANHGLKLEHCDSHFDKILPIAAKI
jgi:predicted nucleic acid-binding protein